MAVGVGEECPGSFYLRVLCACDHTMLGSLGQGLGASSALRLAPPTRVQPSPAGPAKEFQTQRN